jgi:hypothetical protein
MIAIVQTVSSVTNEQLIDIQPNLAREGKNGKETKARERQRAF